MVITLYIQIIQPPANQSFNNLTKVSAPWNQVNKSSSPDHSHSVSPTFPHECTAIKMLISPIQQERSIGCSYCHGWPRLQHETYIEDASDALRFEELSTGRVVIAAEIQKLRQNLGRKSTCRRYLLRRLLQAVPADPTNLPVLELVVMATHETRILPLSFPIHRDHHPHQTNSSPPPSLLSFSPPLFNPQNQTLDSSTPIP